MAEKRIPDPTLMARLQLSVKGVDWAASLVAHKQHEQPDGEWSAHQHLVHLLQVEREIYQPRIAGMVEQDRPLFEKWDADAAAARIESGSALMDLAEEFMRERERTVEVFKGLTAEQWRRTGVWPQDGEVDLAWAAEKVLAHGLEHFVGLLTIHQEVEHLQARQWLTDGQ